MPSPATSLTSPHTAGADTVIQGYRYALDPTRRQARQLASFAGAARFAHNRLLAYVKADLDLGRWERQLLGGRLEPPQGWSLAALRRTWNANKDRWAPWWGEVSKEAFNTGLASLAAALENWSKSRTGTRAGRPPGFPRFKKRGQTRPSVRFTTGAIRLEDDRRSVVLPRLGRIHVHENTRKLHRRLVAGTARILSATCTRDAAGRWHVAFTVEVTRKARARPDGPAVGVDLNCGDIVAATGDGVEVLRMAAPRALRDAQGRLARLQRQAARQPRGSNRRQRTLAAIGKMHARVANLRRDQLHKATTQLATTHHTVVVEDLHVSGMSRRKVGAGARGRGFNRAVLDTAMGEVRRQLTYKTVWYGSTLVVADRWFPSSKTCSGCSIRKPTLLLSERRYVCQSCGLAIDRDRNAAINLARLAGPSTGSGPEDVNSGRREAGESDPTSVGDALLDDPSTLHRLRSGQTGTGDRQRSPHQAVA